MGIWSFLFPSDEDRLRRGRAHMDAGRFADARKELMHCQLPEAEKLYDECSAAIDKGERASRKKQLVAEGFHGWKIEVTAKSEKLRAEVQKLLAEELERGDVDLGLPEVDPKAFEAAWGRAQRRIKSRSNDRVEVRLVPMIEEQLEKRLRAQQG